MTKAALTRPRVDTSCEANLLRCAPIRADLLRATKVVERTPEDPIDAVARVGVGERRCDPQTSDAARSASAAAQTSGLSLIS
jgi:hypothetical protein